MANLVGNAVKYTPSRRHASSSRWSATGGRGRARGAPTPASGSRRRTRSSLFTEFFRSTNPAALDQPGTGLGLAIVARIVARHGGRLHLASELGTGSTFRVVLPAAQLSR